HGEASRVLLEPAKNIRADAAGNVADAVDQADSAGSYTRRQPFRAQRKKRSNEYRNQRMEEETGSEAGGDREQRNGSVPHPLARTVRVAAPKHHADAAYTKGNGGYQSGLKVCETK